MAMNRPPNRNRHLAGQRARADREQSTEPISATPVDSARATPTPLQSESPRPLPRLGIIWFNIVVLGIFAGLGLIYGYVKAIQGVARSRARGLSPMKYVWPLLFWPVVILVVAIIGTAIGPSKLTGRNEHANRSGLVSLQPLPTNVAANQPAPVSSVPPVVTPSSNGSISVGRITLTSPVAIRAAVAEPIPCQGNQVATSTIDDPARPYTAATTDGQNCYRMGPAIVRTPELLGVAVQPTRPGEWKLSLKVQATEADQLLRYTSQHNATNDQMATSILCFVASGKVITTVTPSSPITDGIVDVFFGGTAADAKAMFSAFTGLS